MPGNGRMNLLSIGYSVGELEQVVSIHGGAAASAPMATFVPAQTVAASLPSTKRRPVEYVRICGVAEPLAKPGDSDPATSGLPGHRRASRDARPGR